jgi:DNA repair exonuclease SbcCD ATPase subunit
VESLREENESLKEQLFEIQTEYDHFKTVKT